MRIVSLNAWGGRRLGPLLAFLKNCDADVICLQEVFEAPGVREETLPDNRESSFRSRPNLFMEIKKALPGYLAHFRPFARGWLNDGQTTDLNVHYGIATFVRKECTIISESSGFIFGELRDGPTGTSPLPRNVHVVRVEHPGQDREYTIAHFHGLWQKEGKGDTPERAEQTSRLAKFLIEHTPLGERLIVCGDMNILPASHTFNVLHKSLMLSDLVSRHGITDTRTDLCTSPVRYADYMLVSPQVDVLTFEAPEEPVVSDHRPLILHCV